MQFTFVSTAISAFAPSLAKLDGMDVEFRVTGNGFECLPEETVCQVGDPKSDSVSVQ